MKILALVLALREPPLRTVYSLLDQTLKPKIIVVAGYDSALVGLPELIKGIIIKPNIYECVGKRVGKSLNVILKLVDIEKWDYILKTDDDIIFPREFLEKNVSPKYDLLGRGYALLIRVKPFLKIFKGSFPEICGDDTYLLKVFEACSYKVLPYDYLLPPIVLRKPSYTYKRMIELGMDYYRMGSFLAPFLYRSLTSCIKEDLIWIFSMLGYLLGSLKRLRKFPYSDKIFWYEYRCFLKNFLKPFSDTTNICEVHV